MIEGQVYSANGRVDIIELNGRGLEPYQPIHSKEPTYINYGDFECGTCKRVLWYIRKKHTDTVISNLRYCSYCHILLELDLTVYRLALT